MSVIGDLRDTVARSLDAGVIEEYGIETGRQARQQ